MATANRSRAPRPAAEFLAWAADHARRNRRRAAELAQITTHRECHPQGDVEGQQRAWARRHARERHLHDSALAQLRLRRRSTSCVAVV
ncbi:MAG: hypothetical protein ACKO5F_16000 [Synechococcus sp.]